MVSSERGFFRVQGLVREEPDSAGLNWVCPVFFRGRKPVAYRVIEERDGKFFREVAIYDCEYAAGQVAGELNRPPVLIPVGNMGTGWAPPPPTCPLDLSSLGNRKLEAIRQRRFLTGEDLAAAKEWVEKNCPEFGGKP